MAKKKELKQPDHLQVRLTQLFNWLTRNSRMILLGVAPVIAIIVIYSAYSYYQNQQSIERRMAVADIKEAYNKESKSLAEEEEKLDKQIDSLKDQLEKAEKEKKESINKKIAGLEKKLKNLKPDHSKTLKKYLDFFETNINNPEGWLAGMHAVNTFIEDEKYDQGIETLKKILDHANSLEFYDVQARLMYVGLLTEKKAYDMALKEVEKINTLTKDDSVKAKILLTKARILLYQGKKPQAQELLAKISHNYENTSEAKKARNLKVISTHENH